MVRESEALSSSRDGEAVSNDSAPRSLRVGPPTERSSVEAFEGLIDAHERHDLPNFRTAAYVVAIRRVLDAYEQSGTWP